MRDLCMWFRKLVFVFMDSFDVGLECIVFRLRDFFYFYFGGEFFRNFMFVLFYGG